MDGCLLHYYDSDATRAPEKLCNSEGQPVMQARVLALANGGGISDSNTLFLKHQQTDVRLLFCPSVQKVTEETNVFFKFQTS